RIRRDTAADETLAQTPGGIQHDLVTRFRDRIRAEYHRRRIRYDELLDQDGQTCAVERNSSLTSVFKGARRVQRTPAARNRPSNGLSAANIQVRIVLSSERRAATVFVDRRGTYRHG